MENSEKNSILCLNDDCILQILSYVELHTLLELENVSTRFEYLVQEKYRAFRSFQINFRHIEKISQITKSFERIGPFINTLELFRGQAIPKQQLYEIFDSISVNCTNLTTLKFKYFVLDKTIAGKISEIARISLKTLELGTACTMIDEVEDILLTGINLENILMSGSFITSGRCPEYLAQVKKLNFTKCYEIEYSLFYKFMEKLKNLKSLDISFCNGLNSEYTGTQSDIVGDIVRLQPNLEELHLADIRIHDYNSLSKLKLLTKLTISNTQSPNVDNILIELAKTPDRLVYLNVSSCKITKNGLNALSKFENLSELYLDRIAAGIIYKLTPTKILTFVDVSFSNITEDEFLVMVKKFPSLNRVTAKYCVNLTNALIESIANCFDSLRIQRYYSLRLDVEGTNIKIEELKVYKTWIYKNTFF